MSAQSMDLAGFESTKSTKETVKVSAASKPAAYDQEKESMPMVRTRAKAWIGADPYLFISYSHMDIPQVYAVLDRLTDERFRVWYDESCETGNDFREELRVRIRNCDAVLLFVSKNSMASRFCSMEIIVANKYDKPIFPVYLDDEPVPPAFDMLLGNMQHSTITDMDHLIETLVRDLPPETMNRLTFEGDLLTACKDNGESIDIPEGVTEIQASAFKSKVNLKHIHIPEGVTSIGAESFRGCSRLMEMELPMSVEAVGESAFRDCVNLKTLVIKTPHIKIGERAFENCAALETIVLPDELLEIYGGVFNSCKSLRKIQLPSKLTVLGESAFSDCDCLENIDIPETVTKIDDLVFNGCNKLRAINLQEGLKKIGKGAFKNCTSLTKMHLPTTVSSISDAPFRGCTSLISIQVERKNMSYKSEPNRRDGKDHVLFNKNKSQLIAYPAASGAVEYNIPDSVLVISDWAFCGCKELSRVSIPDSVYELGEGAFCNCVKLDRVEIPDSVIKLDDCAFKGCTSLTSVTIPSTVKELGWGLFDGCEKKVTVYCDEGSAIQAYCLAKGIAEERIPQGDTD